MFLDAVIGFRLEYLYPAIMFLRSVLDSYKYQGLVRKRGREGSCGSFIFDTWLLVLLGFPCYYNNPHSSKHSLACLFYLHVLPVVVLYPLYRYHLPLSPSQIFSLFFIMLVVYLDIICWTMLVGPWLFFMASACVWLELIRSWDVSLGYGSMLLWMLFLYVEVTQRLSFLPTSIVTLLRPFGAHW